CGTRGSSPTSTGFPHRCTACANRSPKLAFGLVFGVSLFMAPSNLNTKHQTLNTQPRRNANRFKWPEQIAPPGPSHVRIEVHAFYPINHIALSSMCSAVLFVTLLHLGAEPNGTVAPLSIPSAQLTLIEQVLVPAREAGVLTRLVVREGELAENGQLLGGI